MSAKRWKSLLGVALVFVLGLVSGAAITMYAHFRFLTRPDLPDRIGAIALRHLTRELDLTEEQRKVVREAMMESRRELRELQREMGPKMDATFAKTRERIRAVLDDEQQKKLDELASRRGAVMGRFFGGPRFGPPGRGGPFGGRPEKGRWRHPSRKPPWDHPESPGEPSPEPSPETSPEQ